MNEAQQQFKQLWHRYPTLARYWDAENDRPNTELAALGEERRWLVEWLINPFWP